MAKYDSRAASTRQRMLQMQPYLAQQNIEIELSPLFDNAYLEQTLTTGKRSLLKTAQAYAKRMAVLLKLRDYDFIWVQYELFPYLPGFAETLICLTKAPVIVDYDDAIFHQYDMHASPWVRALLAHKLDPLLRRANLAFCGNRYLETYVKPLCAQTQIIPTVVDTEQYVPAASARAKPVVGWIGSPSTWRYCIPAIPLLKELVEAGKIEMLVVGAGANADTGLPFTFRAWDEAREIADIQAMDIGIMPVPDDAWARGKCGYKLIQYMACGLPVIASPVGVNSEIVSDGVNGYLAMTQSEWQSALEKLLASPQERHCMGLAGRAAIVERYSIEHYGPKVATAIHELLRNHA